MHKKFYLHSLTPSEFTRLCKAIVELVGGHFGVSEIEDSILLSQEWAGEEVSLKFVPSSGSDVLEMSKKFLSFLATSKLPSIYDGQRHFILSSEEFFCLATELLKNH